MKFSYATIFAVAASLTSAYTTSDIPGCAIACFESGAPQVGCTVTDQTCQCAKASELTDKITGCVTDACSIEDALKTQQVTTGLCEQLSSSASSAAATATGSSVPSSSGYFVTSNSTAPASNNGTALVTAATADSSTSSAATTASATVTESADGDSSSSSASGTASATGSASTANGGNMVGFREGLGLAAAIGMGWYFHF